MISIIPIVSRNTIREHEIIDIGNWQRNEIIDMYFSNQISEVDLSYIIWDWLESK